MKPIHFAHIALFFFFVGFVLQFFASPLSDGGLWWNYLVFGFYLLSTIIGIVALISSKKAVKDKKLGLVGYMEAGLSILPSVLFIILSVFIYTIRR